MKLFKLIGTTNDAIRPYEGKACVVTENNRTNKLRINVINVCEITTSPMIAKEEIGDLIVARTENSAYFFERITTF